MRCAVASEHARISNAAIGNGRGPILRHHTDIEIHQALAGYRGARRSHAVRGMTNRATEAGVYVKGVLREAGVLHDLAGQVMALSAQSVRPVHAEVRIGIKVRDQLAGPWGLVGNILPFQDVSPL